LRVRTFSAYLYSAAVGWLEQSYTLCTLSCLFILPEILAVLYCVVCLTPFSQPSGTAFLYFMSRLFAFVRPTFRFLCALSLKVAFRTRENQWAMIIYWLLLNHLFFHLVAPRVNTRQTFLNKLRASKFKKIRALQKTSSFGNQ